MIQGQQMDKLSVYTQTRANPEIVQGGRPNAMSLAFLVGNFLSKVFGARIRRFWETVCRAFYLYNMNRKYS